MGKRPVDDGSFNTEFWKMAAEVEEIILQKTQVQGEISLRRFGGTAAQ